MSDQATQPLTPRRRTRQILVGTVAVGGDAPISVQSMTKTDSRDVEATVNQIYAYANAGCEIVRVSVPTKKAGEVFHEICARSPIPVVADIHFDYRLALVAADGGAACLRINPGNIGGRDRVKAVVDKAGALGIPIRIGVNGGSLEKDLLEQFGSATPEAMVASALRHIEVLEREGFHAIKISLRPATWSARSRPTACWPGRWTTPSTWGSPRRARPLAGPSGRVWAWASSWPKAWATPSGCP